MLWWIKLGRPRQYIYFSEGVLIFLGIIERLNFPPEKTKMVCKIIGNHHSRSRYDSVELKILKEADRIVNKQEGD